MTLRLVKSTVEYEGRFSEVWTLVDSADDLEPWPEGKRTVVGQPAPRHDGLARVTGAARYTTDVALPGMLHAAVLRAPVARGRVMSVDLDAALAAPGVRAAVGPDTELSGPPNEVGYLPGKALLEEEIEYAGQPIAAVAADTKEAAEAGLVALALELEELPFTYDPAEAVSEQHFTDEPIERSRGDAEKALAEADVRVEVAIETPAHIQDALEPHCAVADWRPDGLTVWLSTQGIFSCRDQLATVFDLPRERVRVIAEFVGGAFGAKIGPGVEAILAAELSRRSGRPVSLVNDRHEEMLDSGRRAATRQSVRIGATRDGKLVAVDCDAVVSAGQGGMLMPFIAARVLTPASILYRCENVTALSFPARLNLRAQNAFRAPGIMEGTAVFEQAMDELATALDLDPIELRRRNHVDFDQESGKPYSSKNMLACYDRAVELAGWADRDRLREPQPDGLLRGMGCASQIWWGSGGPPAQSTVRITSDGLATVYTGMQDTGTGTTTGAQLIAAEELGFTVDRVRVVGGDTASGLVSPLAGGSMTTPSMYPAIRSAAGKARKLLLQLAGDVLEIAPGDLRIEGGRILSSDQTVDIPVTEVTDKLGNAAVEAAGQRGPNPQDVMIQTFGCQIAQVAVDPALGEVRVEKVWAVHDVGRIVNPLTASSQVEGGIIQALGFALSEEQVIDPTTGIPTNATFDDYKVPTIADVPEIVVDFVDLPDGSLPGTGAKGLGEPPIIPTAAAIANAFAHATGRRSKALPLTRARVLEALA